MIQARLQLCAAFTVALLCTACQGQGVSPVGDARAFVSSQTAAVPNASGQSVAYQIDPEHSGYSRGPLHPPLTQLWTKTIRGYSGSFGYPVVANGIVVVSSYDKLIALDIVTGKELWLKHTPKDVGWVGPAYDNNIIFANSRSSFGRKDATMFAFDIFTGKKLWSAPTPGQYQLSSPPTAASGVVYTAAAGVGGTVYAYDEHTGALKWSAPVMNGDNSSPVVTRSGIFVSYACPQTYDFQPSDGTQLWHFSGPCEGGGGSTPVLYDGLLFVGDSQQSSGYNGLILHANDGTIAGAYNANQVPAFAHKRGFFINNSTLEARSVPTLDVVWSVDLGSSDQFGTPPLVVGNIVYAETESGNLLGYNVDTGKQKVLVKLANVGSSVSQAVGLAYGAGELFVPNGPNLVAFHGS